MKNKILVVMASLAFLSLFVMPMFVSQAHADCYCSYKSVSDNDGDTSNDGILKEDLTVDARTCAVIFGKAVGQACDPYSAPINPGFEVPTFSMIIGNVIRLIFFIAGLFALVYLLLGGFEWVQSAGDEKKLESARGKITNAIIGLVVMIAVLSLVIFLEQVVFGGKICLGISCPINVGFLKLIR